jgi:GT2 family glycosyltransferase
MENTNYDKFTRPSVFIIILNWNGWKDTIECLESVINIEFSNFRIVLIDNCSDNDSINKINLWASHKISTCSKHFKSNRNNNNIKIFEYSSIQAEAGGTEQLEIEIEKLESKERLVIIRNSENLGFAKGNNIGLKYALQRNADYAFLLNNDTNIDSSCLLHLIKFMNIKNNYIAVTGQIRYYDNNLIWNCGGYISWYYIRRYLYGDQKITVVPKSGSADVTYLTGCSMLLHLENLRVTGLLCEKYFFGEEDFEFSLRAKKYKFKMACIFESIIYHKIGQSINNHQGSKSINRIFIHYLNRFIDVRLHISIVFWYVWSRSYILYISYILRKNGLTLREIVKFVNKLLNYSIKYNSVEKEFFMQLMVAPIVD